MRAPVLLVDEPIAALDPYHQLQVMAMLRAYAGDGALVVAVLHDLSLVARFCTRVLLLDAGAVVDDDEPERVLNARALERHYRVEPVVTTHEGVATVLGRTAQAAYLLGARVILVGISPEIAKAIVAMGISLADILTSIVAQPPWQLPTTAGFGLFGCSSRTRWMNCCSAAQTSTSVCPGSGSRKKITK